MTLIHADSLAAAGYDCSQASRSLSIGCKGCRTSEILECLTNFPHSTPPTGSNQTLGNRVESMRRARLFRGLLPADALSIAERAVSISTRRSDRLCAEGQPANSVFLITSGLVKLTQLGSAGEEVILSLRGPGDVIGGVGVPSGTISSLSAEVIHPGKVLSWDSVVLESFCGRYPVLRCNTLSILMEHLSEMHERFRELATEPVALRLARALLRIVDHLAMTDPANKNVELSKEELAQVVGTTLFTVSRLLTKWTHLGVVVSRRGNVTINDRRALVEFLRRRSNLAA